MKTVTLVEREDVLVFAADLSAHVGRSVIIPQNGNTFLITVESLNENGVEAPANVKLPTYVEHKRKQIQAKAYSFSCDEEGCKFTTSDYRAAGGHKGKHTKARTAEQKATLRSWGVPPTKRRKARRGKRN